MRKINKIGTTLIICACFLSTSVLALTVASFKVTTSTKNKDVGSKTYLIGDTASYIAEISSVTIAGGQTKASYAVQPKTGTSLLDKKKSSQTISVASANISSRKTWSDMTNKTWHFYVTGKSGTITNSVVIN